jgi:hypothetical protein
MVPHVSHNAPIRASPEHHFQKEVRISFFDRRQTGLKKSSCDRMAATKMDARFIFLTPFF